MDAMETKWEDVIIARVCRENGAFGAAREEDYKKLTSDFSNPHFAQHTDKSVIRKECILPKFVVFWGHLGSFGYKTYVHKMHNYIAHAFCFNP